LAARSFDMPLSFRASYCFSFLRCALFPGIPTSVSCAGKMPRPRGSKTR
jgi:hypothetical protein